MLHPRCVCALGLLGLLGVTAVRAGDIDPPMGPVQGTMKTLDAIEPRNILKTFASSPNAVHLITQPGQYVMTEDISVPSGKSGIVVELPPGVGGDVSIDLNGFSIIGQPGSLHAVHVLAGSNVLLVCYSVDGPSYFNSMGGSGLRVDGALSVSVSGVVVRECGGDGISVIGVETCDVSADVHDCAGNGMEFVMCPTLTCGVAIKTKGTGADPNRVASTGGHGIHAVDCGTVTVVGMSASFCTGDGLHVSGASSVSVTDWRDDDCDGDGIEIAAGLGTQPRVELRDAFSNSAGDNGMRITCSVGRIELARCTGATLHGMDIDCDDLVLSECTSSGNAQCGMTARVRKGMQDIKSLYNDNGWQGALLLPALGSVQEKANKSKCSARGNGFSLPGGGAGFEFSGISSVSMHECDSSANAGSGVVVADMDRDGRLDLVTCASNGAHGLHVTSNLGLPSGRLHLSRVTSDGNTSNGLFLEGTSGGEVSECVAIGNGGTGIFVIGSGHVVRSNSAGGNAGAAMIVSAPGNVVGPLVDELSVAGNCNPAANYVH